MSKNQETETPTYTPAEASALAGRMRAQIKKAVVGQDEALDHVMAAFLAGGHVLVEGVPGLGKTLLVLALARSFDGKFSRVQFTPDLMPSDVTGHAILEGTSGHFRIRRGPAFTNLLLADEINRAPAKTQAALLEVMAEQQITIEGESLKLPAPFMTLATMNPIEHEGTYNLPEAQLDRFLLKVVLDYPPEDVEVAVVRAVTTSSVGDKLNVDAVEPVLRPEDAVALQAATAAVLVDERIASYAVRLVRATRVGSRLQFGAGTRGAIGMVRAARAMALLAGRDFVLPEDIQQVALPALRHRIGVSPEMELEGVRADDVIRGILKRVEAPRR